MTCETPDGKVLESRDVTVWRGDVSTQDFSCGQAAVLGTKKAKKTKKLSKRQACTRRAKHVKGKAKRRAALRRCKKRYPTMAERRAAKRRAAARRR
jgi:hypothetical protein